MAGWDSRFVDYGVVKVVDKKVKVYYGQVDYYEINVGHPINNANWSGSSVVVHLSDGSVRKYRNQVDYDKI